jgi:methionyl-tRNA formyltransferase
MINVVYFGTPEFSTYFLKALHADEDIFVSGLITQPDKPVGRGKIMTPSSTKLFAQKHDIPVFEPTKLKDPNFINEIKKLNADFFVIVAYGKIIPQEILDLSKSGNINVHPSLLPKYRGPSPVQAAIAAGDTETGVSIMLIDAKMDHGPVLMQKTMTIDHNDDTNSMLRKAVDLGTPMLIKSIKKLYKDDITPKEQNHDKATFCKMIKKEDGRINWSESAEIIEAKSRAYQPWPGMFTIWSDKTLKLNSIIIASEAKQSLAPGEVKINDNRLLIGTSTNPIEILEIQPEGKQKMPAAAFIQGYSNIDGTRLN